MKKIFMILAASAVLFSCSKDDKDTTQPTTNNSSNLEAILPGEWKMTHTHQEGTNKLDGQVINTFVTTGSNFKGTALFEANPNKITSDLAYDFETKLTVFFNGNSNTQVTTGVIPQTSTVNTWSINSNGQLDGFTSDPQVSTTPFDVTVKSATEIVLDATVATSTNQQGSTLSSEISVSLTLEKLP